MLIELDKDQSINSDYIINLHIKRHETKWLVLGRMIDGTILNLSEHLSEERAREVYTKIKKEHNDKKD